MMNENKMDENKYDLLPRIYQFYWVKKKVKWNDGTLKCSYCKKVFEIGEKAHIHRSRWLGAVVKILCEKCFIQKERR